MRHIRFEMIRIDKAELEIPPSSGFHSLTFPVCVGPEKENPGAEHRATLPALFIFPDYSIFGHARAEQPVATVLERNHFSIL